MKNGIFIAPINDDEYKIISKVIFSLRPSLRKKTVDIKCFHDNSQEIERIYSVYYISCDDNKYVLKKTTKEEVEIYMKYLNKGGFKVPKFYDSIQLGNHYWILTEFMSGNDGKSFTKEIAVRLSENLSEILNKYWIEEGINGTTDTKRFERYWERINLRKKCLYNYPKLSEAYDIFLKRQKTCPISLCNGDLMQVNMICNEEDVYIIDWAFGGFMPYSLEVARVISHGADSGFAYYMTDELRGIFVKHVYKALESTNLSFEEFCFDVKLASLNENIEFLEYNFNNPNEPRDKYFEFDFERANRLANEILEKDIKQFLNFI